MSKFIPRATFPKSSDLPRSYFLGHHAAGLAKMKTMLSSIDLVIECRDYRVPLVSRNPLFEESLAGRERLIVYTKRDLGSKDRPSDYAREATIKKWHHPSPVLFFSKAYRDILGLLDTAKQYAASASSLTGYRIMVVGMPNVGKSTLLNSLRRVGLGGGKCAKTGDQPGVTRSVTQAVKIVRPDKESGEEGIYAVDTPGVFMPYVPNAEAMMKLSLVGCVKDAIIDPILLLDYWLYIANKRGMWELYMRYLPHPTNDVDELLEGLCKRIGKIKKGGKPDINAGAIWMLQKYRGGSLGHFVLDDVEDGGLERAELEQLGVSLNQAKKARKEARKHDRPGTTRVEPAKALT